jgi:hypothetical protein
MAPMSLRTFGFDHSTIIPEPGIYAGARHGTSRLSLAGNDYEACRTYLEMLASITLEQVLMRSKIVPSL